jgi:hypothetical protein
VSIVQDTLVLDKITESLDRVTSGCDSFEQVALHELRREGRGAESG